QPSAMLSSHMPVDPKWQLKDSVLAIATWEAAEPKPIPRKFQDFEAEIGAIRHSIRPEQRYVEGINAYEFNARNGFDIGNGHVQKGKQFMDLTSLVPENIPQWKRGRKLLDTVPTYLNRYLDTIKVAHRARLREIAALKAIGGRGYGCLARDYARLEACSDSDRKVRIGWGKQRGAEAYHDARTRYHLRRTRFNRPPKKSKVTDRNRARLQAGFRKSMAAIPVHTDSVQAAQARLFATSARLNNMESRQTFLRNEAFDLLKSNTFLLMLYAEYYLKIGFDDMLVLQDTISKGWSQRRATQRKWRLHHDQGRRSMAKLHKSTQRGAAHLRRMFKQGFSAEYCQAKLDSLTQGFEAGDDLRDEGWTAIDQRGEAAANFSQENVSKVHRTIRKARRQHRILRDYVQAEVDFENGDFNSEVALTAGLRGRSRQYSNELLRRQRRVERAMEKAKRTAAK
ncbi:MAG: hypothetical protein AAF570_11220, partial [Bacteroidota bacterium]